MPSKKSILLKSQGFTLVELLIVVAIIGVLASQGVPAYRRMIMKSRKGEAQIMLGNIATAESAFFSEYGSYGSHLARMGAVMEGIQFVYAGGVNFVGNACNLSVAPNVFPPINTVDALGANPAYYQEIAAAVATTPLAPGINLQRGNRVGRNTQTACLATIPMAIPVAPAPASYQASATGYIRGGNITEQDNCKQVLANCDQWTITQNRNLININDGIN